MEPPRLYHYTGLFTSCRSIDLPLKILTTFVVLVILVFLAAWHLSRKSYRRAPSFEKTIHNVGVLFNDDSMAAVISLGSKSKMDLLTTKMGKSMVLVINDWKIMTLYWASENLDCFYSAAPSSLRRNWYGLLISDSTLPHRTNLRSILLHAFDSLPMNAYLSFGYISSCTLHTLGNWNISGVLGSHCLDLWLRPIVTDFLFFGYHEFWKNPETTFKFSTEVAFFINRFAYHITELKCYHFDGNVRNIDRLLIDNEATRTSTVAELLSDLRNLIHPLIQRLMSPNLISDETAFERKDLLDHSLSFLDQLIRSYREMELQGEYLGFLKLDHISHSLCEIGMILHVSLIKHLRLLLVVLSQRPLWQSRLANEANFARDKILLFDQDSTVKRSSRLLGDLFEQSTCLVWTKSLVCESMRICCPTWPVGCIRQTVRDGELNGFEYAEGELVLFNEPFHLSDPELWENGVSFPDDAKCVLRAFNPMRFMDCEPDTTKVHHLKWPVHWAQFMLKTYNVCIPNETVYRMLITLLLHLFWNGWKVRAAMPEDLCLSDDPVWIPSNLPDVHLQPPHQR